MSNWKALLLEIAEFATFLLFLSAFVCWTAVKLWAFVRDLLSK